MFMELTTFLRGQQHFYGISDILTGLATYDLVNSTNFDTFQYNTNKK